MCISSTKKYSPLQVAENIKIMASKRNISVKKILENAGLGFNTMSNMKNSMPKANNLAKIADCLNCSVDFLLGRSPVEEVQSSVITDSTISPELQPIVNKLTELNTAGLSEASNYISYIISSKPEYKKTTNENHIAG